nr:HAMP domain-containing sensor histidine kinase [Massilia sp. YIM B02769]
MTSSFIVSRCAVLLCALIALANTVGWVFGLPVLVSVLPSLPKMVPATTLLLVLATASLACQARALPLRVPALCFGAAAALLGLTMALGHLFKLPIGPFLAAAFGSQSAISLSSTFTSLVFMGLGISLSLFALRRSAVLAQAAAMAVFLVSLLNASVYFFRDTFLFEVLPGQGVAITTTLSALMLSVGVLFLQPRHGIMAAVTSDLPAIRIARRLLLSAVLVPLGLGIGVTLALKAELYDAVSALPLLVWGTIVVFTVIIWRLCLQLHEVEVARQHAEAEVRRAMHELHAADQRKDVFLATLAHELRNPLAPIKATAQLLGRTGATDPEHLRRMSGIIERQVDHLVNLVEDLMDVSRVRSGQIALEQAPVDLNSVIGAAHEQVRPLIERRHHALRIDAPAHPVWVLGDGKRLVQVLANLLNNAAKYTPPNGKLYLTLRAHGRQAEIAVRDDGAGIEAALLPSVFEMFTQAALTPERSEGGLGMGLALVKRLTEMHGGSVRADSAGAGRGSTFTVVLPLVDPASLEPD